MRCLSLLAVSMTVVLTAAAPRAQSRATFVPSLSVGTVHDDNLFSRERAVGDYMTELRPAMEARYESPTTTLEGYASMDMQLSARHSALNSFDSRRHALVDSRVRTTPSLTLGLAGRYDKTESPGELNLDTAILLDRQRAERLQLTPSIGYRLQPRTMLTTQYDWTNETLGESFHADLHVLRLGVSRQQSERHTWSLNYLGRLFEDGPQTHHSQAALVGWSARLSPATSLSVLAGPRVTSYRGTTAEVLGALIRRTPRSRFLIDYWHGETIVLGIHGPVRIQSGTSKLSWTLRRTLELGVHTGLFHSTTLGQADARVYHAGMVGAWTPRPSYILAVSYGADFQRGDIRSQALADQRVRRGVFLVRLTMAPRFSRAFKPSDEPESLTTPVRGVPR